MFGRGARALVALAIAIVGVSFHAPDAGAAEQKTVLAVRFRFAGSAAPYAASEAEFRNVLFEAPDSLAKVWERESSGTIDVAGTVLTVPAMPGAATCDGGRISSHYGTFPGYDYVVFVPPLNWACGHPSIGFTGGRESYYFHGLHTYLGQQMFPHQMGHSLRMVHAGGLECGSAAMSANCAATENEAFEYADPYDIMGASRPLLSTGAICNYSAWNRQTAGWPVDKVVAAGTGGRFTLEPTDDRRSAAPEVLVVARNNADRRGREYWIEFRKQNRLCTGVLPTAQRGLQIRVVPVDASRGEPFTRLVDTTPGSNEPPGYAAADFLDADLLPGRTFHDPVSDVSITLVSMGADSAVIDVERGSEPNPPPPPPPSDGDVYVEDETLHIVRPGAVANEVSVTKDGDVFVVGDEEPLVAGPGCQQVGSFGARCDGTGVTATSVQLGPGDDTFIASAVPDGPTTISGGNGRDTVSYAARTIGVTVTLDQKANDGGAGERDNVKRDVEGIYGGNGDDRLEANGGKDRLRGGPGNDELFAKDGLKDLDVDCGPGAADKVRKDKVDPATGCETTL